MEKKLKSNNIDNYFIDVTYKVLPKYNKNKYKLLTIIGIDNNSKSSYLCALILIKYEDSNSFNKIFSYLNNMYEFNQRIVHIDYSVSLTKSLKEGGFFKKKPIIVHYFFHYMQAILKKMKNLKMVKTKLNKRAFEIIRNIELVCFIPYKFIKTYISF